MMAELKIKSLLDNPAELEFFIGWFAGRWGNEAVYRDCMSACINFAAPLP
ncbi:MAG: hypothetical protein PHI35_04270 [Victivallaceae bacterium]|nr:hypothetical protein [Victivallaceae bacterium]